MSNTTNDRLQDTSRKLGPHGYGDPDDRKLRKTEKNVLIPQRRREIVREEYCPNEIKEYQDCVLQTGLFTAPLKCAELKIRMADCLEFWNDNDDVHRRAKEEYLKERSEFRRTGVCKQDREFIKEYVLAQKTAENSSS